jgi:uncharacterized membrane protein YfcA
MNILIGFLIALAAGMAGIGGGSFTVPALVSLVGCPPARLRGRSLFSRGPSGFSGA